MQGLVAIKKMEILEVPQNATPLFAGILSKALTNSSRVTGSMVALETGNGTSRAFGLRSIKSISLSFARAVMNSPSEIHLITRLCTPAGSVSTPRRVGRCGSEGMMSLRSRPTGRLIRHIEYIGAARSIPSRINIECILCSSPEKDSLAYSESGGCYTRFSYNAALDRYPSHG